MKRSKFSDEQIVGVVKQVGNGLPIEACCRQHGISKQTFYRWRAKYGGMEVSEAHRLRDLEVENRTLKRLVANYALDILALKDAVAGKDDHP